MIMVEHSKWSLKDKNVLWLICGFLVPLVVFLTINKLCLGKFGAFIFSDPPCIYNSIKQHLYGDGGNIIAGLWKLLFDSPHGVFFLMPVTLFVPMGIIAMWRTEMRSVSVIVGVLLLYAVILISSSPCPITGDSLGSRQLLPFIPLLVIPLAFFWNESTGEKVCLICTLVLTVYMCSFGWWTGKVKGRGVLIGALQDSNARYIILARKNELSHTRFRSSNELVEYYINSLKKRDMKRWLETLDPVVLDEIYGFERTVFSYMSGTINTQDFDRNKYIVSVDPDRGIQPVLPNLDSLIRMQNDEQ